MRIVTLISGQLAASPEQHSTIPTSQAHIRREVATSNLIQNLRHKSLLPLRTETLAIRNFVCLPYIRYDYCSFATCKLVRHGGTGNSGTGNTHFLIADLTARVLGFHHMPRRFWWVRITVLQTITLRVDQQSAVSCLFI